MKFFKLTFMAILLLPLTAAAQYSQDWRYDDQISQGELNQVARRLSRDANMLWNMVRYRSEFRRPQLIGLYNNIRNFSQTARFYRDYPSDWRARQLVRQADDINRQVNRNDLPFDFRNRWFRTADQVALISQFYGIEYDWNRNLARTDPYYSGDYDSGGYGSGMFRWRGRVDGSDIIYLRGNRVDINHLQAQPASNWSFDLSSPLPSSPVDVQVTKLSGRGRVQVVQQPSPGNNFTAGVMIEDNQAGADWYEFELHW